MFSHARFKSNDSENFMHRDFRWILESKIVYLTSSSCGYQILYKIIGSYCAMLIKYFAINIPALCVCPVALKPPRWPKKEE